MPDPNRTISAAEAVAQIYQNSQIAQQQLGEIAKNLRTDGIGSAIASFYKEARRFVQSFDAQSGLRYRPATINLAAAITGAGTASSGSDSMRISPTEDFIVEEVRTFLVLSDLTNEPNAPATLGAGNVLAPSERALAKALNCRVQLQNKDSKVPIMENVTSGFASLCPEVGGAPMRFGPEIVPHWIIPHNVTMQAEFTLQSANAFFNTAATTYGIAISGVYISRDRY